MGPLKKIFLKFIVYCGVEYVETFNKGKINGAFLARGLDADDYKELGVVRIHSRRMDVEFESLFGLGLRLCYRGTLLAFAF